MATALHSRVPAPWCAYLFGELGSCRCWDMHAFLMKVLDVKPWGRLATSSEALRGSLCFSLRWRGMQGDWLAIYGECFISVCAFAGKSAGSAWPHPLKQRASAYLFSCARHGLQQNAWWLIYILGWLLQRCVCIVFESCSLCCCFIVFCVFYRNFMWCPGGAQPSPRKEEAGK